MSLSVEQRLDGYRFFAVAFGAAPGSGYYKDLVDAYEFGLTTKEVVNIFTTKDGFTSIYSPQLNYETFANLIVENVVGNSASIEVKSKAKIDVAAALSANLSRGDVIYNVFNNLAKKSDTDKDWANTAKKMNNQVEVAKFVSEYWPMATENAETLRNALKNITHETNVSSVQAIKNVITSAGLNLGGLTLYTSASDSIKGTDGADRIDGGAGNDTIEGGAGNDVLIGGSGNDYLYGGWGQDYIEGSDGADRIELGDNYKSEYISGYYDTTGKWVYGKYVYYVDNNSEFADGGDGADTIYGGYGSDLLYGGEGADLIHGDGSYSLNSLSSTAFDSLNSSEKAKLYNDTIYGEGGKDTIRGGYGNDVIFGGEGDDELYSGPGNDYVDGGSGNDYITSSSGSDIIFGGDGNDYIKMDYLESGTLAYISGGAGNDSINLVFDGEGGKAKIESGEGIDNIYVRVYNDSALEIDLAEIAQNKDTIQITWADYNKSINPVAINNFSLANDKLDVGYFDIYGKITHYNDDPISTGYNGVITRNLIQTVDSSTTEWLNPMVNESTSMPDSFGKGVLIIKGGAAASADTTTVAKFLDSYGNNATYGASKIHIFLLNIQDVGLGVYQFKDDTGANNRIVSDEITPIAVLTGLNTAMLNPTQSDFFLI